VPPPTPSDRLRIAEKLAYAIALGPNPTAANPLLEDVLAVHIQNPAHAPKTVKLLLKRARQFFIELRTEEALVLLAQAVQIADVAQDRQLSKLANGTMANYLLGLGLYEQAQNYVMVNRAVDAMDDSATRRVYYAQRAILEAAFGSAPEAFECFDAAVREARAGDVFDLVRILTVYGDWSFMLGDVERARSCMERSLFVARQSQVTLLIVSESLQYADILTKTGQYDLAYQHLLRALSYDVQAPMIDAILAQFGIPLALHMKDKQTLGKCVRLPVIEQAFRSGMLSHFAPMFGAFAQWHVAQGHAEQARVLLGRAVSELPYIVSGDFPIAVARYGASKDIPRARVLLEELAGLPNGKITRPFLLLFDAFAAKRAGRRSKASKHASEAIRHFDALGIFGYSDLARTLCATPAIAVSEVDSAEPTPVQFSMLTSREREVAEFVIKGLTNREIGEKLSISRHTVDSHVASIIGRLGLRSRHQLGVSLAHWRTH
jgi:ATP/maltotriose-dependent transcriptional regulator MalT